MPRVKVETLLERIHDAVEDWRKAVEDGSVTSLESSRVASVAAQ